MAEKGLEFFKEILEAKLSNIEAFISRMPAIEERIRNLEQQTQRLEIFVSNLMEERKEYLKNKNAIILAILVTISSIFGRAILKWLGL